MPHHYNLRHRAPPCFAPESLHSSEDAASRPANAGLASSVAAAPPPPSRSSSAGAPRPPSPQSCAPSGTPPSPPQSPYLRAAEDFAGHERARNEQVWHQGTWRSLDEHISATGWDLSADFPAPRHLAGQPGWDVLEGSGLFVRRAYTQLGSDKQALLAPFMHPEEVEGGALVAIEDMEVDERCCVEAALGSRHAKLAVPWAKSRRLQTEPLYEMAAALAVAFLLPEPEFELSMHAAGAVPYACSPGHRRGMPDIAVYPAAATTAFSPFAPACVVGEMKGIQDPTLAEPQLAMYMAATAILLTSIGESPHEVVVPGFTIASWRAVLAAMTCERADSGTLRLVYTRVVYPHGLPLEGRAMATAFCRFIITARRIAAARWGRFSRLPDFRLRPAAGSPDDDEGYRDEEYIDPLVAHDVHGSSWMLMGPAPQKFQLPEWLNTTPHGNAL